MLDAAQLEAFHRDGFLRFEAFADTDLCDAMLQRVIDIVAHPSDTPALVMPESNLKGTAAAKPEDLVSKVFKLHRDTVFNEFALSTDVTDIVADLIAPDLDCFLSQFIFKNPGAWGQPWHQDSFYFPFEPARPIVGVWLAVSEATLENGCLHVLPGSQHEPVHEHVPDRRPGANYGYVEIVDHDMAGAVPVLMNPGDLLLFDSHLMHRSTDNVSQGYRAAMVYHYAVSGTKQRTDSFVNDFMPARTSSVPA